MEHIPPQSKLAAIVLSLLSILISLPLNAQESQTPTIPCDFVGYEVRPLGLVVGDDVCATDTQGNALAKFIVDVSGQFGFLTIPADNPESDEKDGAQEGEAVSFYINGVEQEAASAWTEGGLKKVDLGTPKIPLSVEITSPQPDSAVSASPVNIAGYVNDPQAQVEITLNNINTFRPQVSANGTFSIDNVDLAEGANIISASAEDAARNTATSQISLYLGWVLHLKDVPWYKKEQAHYSGAATCKMILDYLRQEDQTTGLAQDELYNYGHPLNLEENGALLELDAKAVDAVLGHFDKYDTPGNYYDQRDGDGDPYHGYNYGIHTHDPDSNAEAFNEYLRDIIHWIAYPVTVDYWWLDATLAARPNSPAAVPASGTYAHWVVVNGAVASADPTPYPRSDPWFTPEVVVYGFWLFDPAQEGIGEDVYVTASEAGNTYFLPLQTGDKYHGQYLQVAEPPEQESQAEISIAREQFNQSTLNLVKIAQDLDSLNKISQTSLTPFEQRMHSLKSHLYDTARVVNLEQENVFPSLDTDLTHLFERSSSFEEKGGISWSQIIEPQALTDAEFKAAVEGSIAREFIKVEREDNNSSYYIIPFDKYSKGQFLTYAAIIIDGATGAFKQASWVKEPLTFVPIDKSKAEGLAQEAYQQAYFGHPQSIESRLIWQPQGLSSSPFFPYWKVTIDNQTFYVTQDAKLTIHLRGVSAGFQDGQVKEEEDAE